MKEYNVNIKSVYDNVASINKEVRSFLSREGIEPHVLNAFDICLMESVNNVIKHSYKNANDKVIEITLRIDTKSVELLIIDEGESRSNLEIEDLDYDPKDINNLPERGMGLHIIKQLMDELNYYSQNGKNYFVLKKWLY